MWFRAWSWERRPYWKQTFSKFRSDKLRSIECMKRQGWKELLEGLWGKVTILPTEIFTLSLDWLSENMVPLRSHQLYKHFVSILDSRTATTDFHRQRGSSPPIHRSGTLKTMDWDELLDEENNFIAAILSHQGPCRKTITRKKCFEVLWGARIVHRSLDPCSGIYSQAFWPTDLFANRSGTWKDRGTQTPRGVRITWSYSKLGKGIFFLFRSISAL